jgi:hypothetical protein
MDLSHGGTDDEQVLVDQGNVHSWNLNEITVHHLHQENTSETKLPVDDMRAVLSNQRSFTRRRASVGTA